MTLEWAASVIKVTHPLVDFKRKMIWWLWLVTVTGDCDCRHVFHGTEGFKKNVTEWMQLQFYYRCSFSLENFVNYSPNTLCVGDCCLYHWQALKSVLALFPGTREGGEKGPGFHCLRLCLIAVEFLWTHLLPHVLPFLRTQTLAEIALWSWVL